MTEEQKNEQLKFYQELEARQSNEIGRLSTEIIKANMAIANLTAQLQANENREG